MTKTQFHALPPMSRPHAHADTIYRDTPCTAPTSLTAWRSFPRLHAQALPGDRASNRILLGLAALLLPTVAYSFAQMYSLVSSGALEHAVRAFFP